MPSRPRKPSAKSLEGMLLTPQGPVTVSDNYSLNQYGEIGLAGGTTPLEQPTAVAEYGSATYTATVAANAARGIKLDDGATTNFLKDAATKALELPYLTTADPVRVGAPVSFKTNVVLSYANGSWKFQPLTHLTPANAEAVQPVELRRHHPHGRSGGRGRQPQNRLVQRAELLPHHGRHDRRLQVLQRPRTATPSPSAAAATSGARPTPRTSSASRTRSSPPSPSPAPTSCPSWRSRTRRSSARTATTPWPSWLMP